VDHHARRLLLRPAYDPRRGGERPDSDELIIVRTRFPMMRRSIGWSVSSDGRLPPRNAAMRGGLVNEPEAWSRSLEGASALLSSSESRSGRSFTVIPEHCAARLLHGGNVAHRRGGDRWWRASNGAHVG